LDDAQLFRQIRDELFVAAVGDVLDTMGWQHQFLPPGIAPLEKSMRIVGRAMPVLEADLADGDDWSNDAFGLMFRALDDLKRGEVYICTGASPLYALWGGLMSTRAMSLGATGAVLDGYHRDTRDEVVVR